MKMNFLATLFIVSILHFGIGNASAANLTIFGITREVREVPRLDFEVISNSKTWAVVEFVPRVPGSKVTIQEMRRDSNQKLVPVGPPEGPLATGKLRIIDYLTAHPKPLINSYKWTVPSEAQFFKGPRDLEREDRFAYSVFIDGGTAICKIDPQQSGEARFTPALPIPSAWQGAAVPAYQFHTANKSLFAATSINQADQARFKSLMNNKNPFIAVAACRRLNEAGKLDAKFVAGSLARARGLRQSVFTYLLTRGTLKQSPGYSVHFTRTDLAPQAAQIARFQNVSGLRNLAVGVFAAGVSDAYDPFEKGRVPFRGFGPTLLRAIAERTRELKITKPRNQDERDLLVLLQSVKLR